ncbi:MAG: addiction module protein, partial [Hydrocarboniphaga effusa]|nr:addiction module protein [Hydrocarboniphaga effusa]
TERIHLALAAWESLVADPTVAADRALDPEGLKIAAARDQDIESGKVKSISHKEFLRRTAKK